MFVSLRFACFQFNRSEQFKTSTGAELQMLRGKTAAQKFRDLYVATCKDVGIEPAISVLEQLKHTAETVEKLDLSAHHLQSKVIPPRTGNY